MKTADKTLKTIQTKEIFVDIYTDNFGNSYYGFIRKFSENFLLLEHYNDDGIYNGILIFRREDITRVKWENNNTKSALKTITRQILTENLDDINIESIETIIETVHKTFKHITIHIQEISTDWCIIGQVVEMDNETILIKEYGTMSSLDRGMLMIAIADITRVDAGGIYERNLLKIHEENN